MDLACVLPPSACHAFRYDCTGRTRSLTTSAFSLRGGWTTEGGDRAEGGRRKRRWQRRLVVAFNQWSREERRPTMRARGDVRRRVFGHSNGGRAFEVLGFALTYVGKIRSSDVLDRLSTNDGGSSPFHDDPNGNEGMSYKYEVRDTRQKMAEDLTSVMTWIKLPFLSTSSMTSEDRSFPTGGCSSVVSLNSLLSFSEFAALLLGIRLTAKHTHTAAAATAEAVPAASDGPG
jgi:hypothetical protein